MSDPFGNVAAITEGAGLLAPRSSSLTCTPDGYVDTLTDALGRVVDLDHNPFGRVTRQTLPDGRIASFGYDPEGNVTAITPPGRPAHVFAYNAVGLEATYDPPDVRLVKDTTTFTYNLAQQLTQVVRPDDKLIDLGYDAGGRLSTLTLPRGTLAFGYDAVTGNLSTLTAPDGGSLSFAYTADLLTSTTWSGAVSGTVVRSYDRERRVVSRSVNGASTVTFGFDADGLLARAGDLTLTRDPQHGLLTGAALGGVTTATGYNAFAELASDAADVAGVREYEVAYTRDALGRITKKTETSAWTLFAVGAQASAQLRSRSCLLRSCYLNLSGLRHS